MTFLVDLDDTLIMYPDSFLSYEFRGGENRYKLGIPNKKRIKKINKLYKKNTIVIYTGRGWEKYKMTKKQLKKFGIKHHTLLMGKPFGIYIDADSLREIP